MIRVKVTNKVGHDVFLNTFINLVIYIHRNRFYVCRIYFHNRRFLGSEIEVNVKKMYFT